MKLKLFMLLLILQTQIATLSAIQRDWKSENFTILSPAEKKPARTAVLIMCPPSMGNSYNECRWQLGKKVWEQYMKAHPNIDCYFLQTTDLRKEASEQTWIEGNTIYVGDWFYENQRIDRQLHRTIKAIEKLIPDYTHFIRTNLNSFWNLKGIHEYAETHHQSMFTGPLWQNAWYVIGYGIFFSADVANHIVNEYRRLEGKDLVSYRHPEDAIITALATGVFPHYECIKGIKGEHPYYECMKGQNEFMCCPSLPFGVRQLMCRESLSATRLSKYGLLLFPAPSFERALDYCKAALDSVLLYRIRDGFDLDKLAELYQFLLNNIYPELPEFDLVEYAKSLPTTHEGNT